MREARLLPQLDEWLGEMFNPAEIDMTCQSIANALSTEGAVAPERIEAIRERIRDCDRRLRDHRRGLEAGVDPALIAM